jgi:simple sugar transport system permease protein
VTFDENSERLQRIGFGHVHDGVWIALGSALFVSYLMLGHRFGLFLSAIGLSPKGSKASGLPVPVVVILTVLIGGGLCGLAGFVIVAGQEYRLTQYVIHDLTFSAILIAFLARFNPIAVVPVSFLVAGMFTAGETLKAFYQLPLSLILVVQAVILGSVISVEFFSAYRVRINGFGLSNRQIDEEQSQQL